MPKTVKIAGKRIGIGHSIGRVKVYPIVGASLAMAKLSSEIPSCQPLVVYITCGLISRSKSDPVSIFDGLISLFSYFLSGLLVTSD